MRMLSKQEFYDANKAELEKMYLAIQDFLELDKLNGSKAIRSVATMEKMQAAYFQIFRSLDVAEELELEDELG